MSQNDLPKDGRTYRIWTVVEDHVLDKYDRISDEGMRGTYYLMREWLERDRDAGRITDAEFDYFVENYEYYRDDFWPRIEEKNGIRRPETKPPTIVIEDGDEYTEQRIEDAWYRARGFIFVEKSGMAENLTPLSEHGWLIVAAQGESTRTFREKIANDDTDRPVLAITDADFYGGGITESLKGHSDRTEHLGLWHELEERVQGLGLTQDDADALDLPEERDPTQSPDEWRVELDSLTVLKDRHDIENPLLSYTVAKMCEQEIPVTPLPIQSPRHQVTHNIRRTIEKTLEDAIEEIAQDVVEEKGANVEASLPTEGTGPLMELREYDSADDAMELGELRDELYELGKERYDQLLWHRQSKYEERVVGEVGETDVTTIEERLGA
jgi:5S rRNA maturation endonuclease (ribonuclease M5)